MSPPPDERDRIRAATERILNGVPERSNGALIIVALAIKADVPRNALTQRHLVLKNEFYVLSGLEAPHLTSKPSYARRSAN